MLDYHLHLWPHGEREREPTIEHLAGYCEAAAKQGITELAITEHLFRFVQAAPLAGFWEDDPNTALRAHMAGYWAEHCHADLDAYVETGLAAKASGLPVVLGLEVDHYAGRMDRVASILDGYPFDVLLGSVHWIGAWGFDILGYPTVEAEWDNRAIDDVWDAYTEALEEIAASGVCDVLAHPDLCKITGRMPMVPDEFYDRMAEAAAASGLAAEVSSAGWRKPVDEAYPSEALLARFRALGVPVTTASDAHQLRQVAFRSSDLRMLLAAAGYSELQAYGRRVGRSVPI